MILSIVIFVPPAPAADDLLHGMSPRELRTALDSIENVAAARAAAHDCATAISAYEIAIDIARQTDALAKAAFYFRRTGMCLVEQQRTDLALAAYREGIAAAEQTDDTEILAENLHGAAVQLGRLGRYREELPLSEREYELTLKCGHPDHQLRALFTYSSVLTQLGRYRQGLTIGERALEVAHHATLPNAVDFATGNLAQFYADLGDIETGLRLERSVVNPNANDLNAIGVMERTLHHHAEAERAYQAALAKATAPDSWRSREAILFNLGILQRELKEFSAAQSTQNETLKIAASQKDVHLSSLADAELSQLASDEKNTAEALRYAGEALRLARESDAFEAIGNALLAQGRALDLEGHVQEAGQVFAESVANAEGMRAESPASPAGLQSELLQWVPAYQASVDHELRAKHPMEALRLADRAKARVLLDMLEGGQSGFEAFADPEERAEAEKARSEVVRARHAAIARPDAASKSALEKALRGAEDLDVRLYARHPELVLQRAPAPDIGADQLALLAGGRTAILSYFVMSDSVALFVIRGGGAVPSVQSFSLAGSEKLDARIRAFRDQISTRDLDYRATARALFDALIGPAAASLRGTDRWIVSPDGALWDLPFQALIDASGRYVIETHALTFAPSLSSLSQLRAKPANRGGISLLAVANPDVKGAASIPAAEREAQTIMGLYGSSRAVLLAKDRARPALFRDSAANAAVIHIASHAEIEPNHPLESFLLLSPDSRNTGKDDDGALAARDILGMHLHANLVVLSACETARGKVGQGEGALSLGWAVLAAGARAAVVSQWKVDSDATSDLMIGFHQRLTGSRPLDKADALRQSSLAMMKTPERRHPFYWAPFMVIGDSR